MTVNGVTYKNTYYIIPQAAEILRLHFHELVHVAQWGNLGELALSKDISRSYNNMATMLLH